MRLLDLAQLLPINIRQHLLMGSGEAEHRLMTPAFIHFMGAEELLATEGPEALADALEHVLANVQRKAFEHQVAFFAHAPSDCVPGGTTLPDQSSR